MKVFYNKRSDWWDVYLAKTDYSDISNSELYSINRKQSMDYKRYRELAFDVFAKWNEITEEEYNASKN